MEIKKIISKLLILVMLLNLVISYQEIDLVYASQESVVYEFGGGVTGTLEAGTLTVSKTDTSGTGVINDFSTQPSKPSPIYSVQGITDIVIEKGVKTIGRAAFYKDYNSKITGKVTIGEDVEKIGIEAFRNIGLTELIIGKNVKEIGYSAFNHNGLTELTIGESVAIIGGESFANNKLTTLRIPDSVTAVERYAFAYNELTALTIGENVTTISDSAFSDIKLTKLTIPDSVKTIENYVFLRSPLTEITMPAGVVVGERFCSNGNFALGYNNNNKKAGIYIFDITEGIWKEKKPAVIFNSNGGSNVSSLKDIESGSTIPIPIPPTKDGYIFKGWYREEALTNKWNFDTDKVTEDTTLHAKWTAIKYTVTFDSNGGSDVSSITDLIIGSDIKSPTSPIKEGYTFEGWYKDLALENKWDFEADTVIGDTTLYAKWTGTKHTVTFDSNGGNDVDSIGNIVLGDKISSPTSPTKAGYTFEGWYKDSELLSKWDFEADTVTENTKLYAKWTEIKYTVTFDSNGGTDVSSIIDLTKGSDIKSPTSPIKEGYTFEGWYKDLALENKWDFEADTVKGDTTLYAKWTGAKHTVTFDSNGGTDVSPIPDLTKGSDIKSPTSPIKEGYTFEGWYKDLELENKWDFEADTVKGDTTLYAKWTEAKHTVTFDSNGGTDVSPIPDLTKGSDIESPTSPTKEGYTFEGWYKDLELENKWDFETDTVTENTTLYAKWTEIKYTVMFNTNGGSEITSIEKIIPDSIITAPTSPTKLRYEFQGWYKEARLTNKWDFNTDTVTANTILYAKWKKVNVNSGGSGGSSSGGGTVNTGDSSTTVVVPSKPTDSPDKPTETIITVKSDKENVMVPQKTVSDAIGRAKQEAKASNTEQNGISVEIKIDSKNSNSNNLSVNLPKITVDELSKEEVKEFKVNSDTATLSLDLETIKTIQKEANTDINLSVKKVDNRTLSEQSKRVVGNRPVFDITITGTNGKKMSNFGKGKVSVSIPYILGEGEKVENLVVYYISDDGRVEQMPNSIYDENTKVLRFVTDHFSKFAVGYNIKEFEVQKNVALDKVWTIRFNKMVDEGSVNENTIYIQDETGNKITLDRKVENNTVILTPKVNYKPATKYTIHVTDGVESNKRILKPYILKSFETVK